MAGADVSEYASGEYARAGADAATGRLISGIVGGTIVVLLSRENVRVVAVTVVAVTDMAAAGRSISFGAGATEDMRDTAASSE